MIITKYVEAVGELCTNKFNGAAVGSLVGSIDDAGWMVDGFVRDTEVDLIEEIIGELEGAEGAVAFNATEGSVVVVELSVGSRVES